MQHYTYNILPPVAKNCIVQDMAHRFGCDTPTMRSILEQLDLRTTTNIADEPPHRAELLLSDLNVWCITQAVSHVRARLQSAVLHELNERCGVRGLN